jgi:DNA-binding GntR family transcriptional regulator
MNIDLFRSKNERIYELLKTKIIRGELKPGDPIVIDTLAAQIGVSAIPIREALRHLEANGFVTIAPYVGARVAPLEAASIREVFETLEALETVSARAACERATDTELESLAQGINAMRGLTDNPDAWSAHNKALHQTVCQIAGMRLVEKMLTVALDHWDRLRCAYLDDVFAQRVADGQAEHERMLDALRRRDPDGLVQGIEAHNRAAYYAYIAHLERKGLLETAK